MRSGLAMARCVRAAFVLLLLYAANAFAFPVTWTLNGATFSDGGTASGYVVYDADTLLVSDWSIDVAGGNTATFPPLTYTPANSSGDFNAFDGISIEVTDGSQRGVRLPATPTYSDAGGTVDIDLANLYQGECFNCSPYRSFTAGTLTGFAQPVFTSANATTFVTNAAGSFAVTVTGTPTLALTQSGTLPSGVTFVDNGNGSATLAGTATAAGVFPLVLSASNGGQTPTTQDFTLTVVTPAPPPTPAPTLGLTAEALLVLSLLALAAMAGFRVRRCGA